MNNQKLLLLGGSFFFRIEALIIQISKNLYF